MSDQAKCLSSEEEDTCVIKQSVYQVSEEEDTCVIKQSVHQLSTYFVYQVSFIAESRSPRHPPLPKKK
jgi:hypothetical protein